MNTDKSYQQLVTKMHEISSLTPQTVGPLTPLYRRIIPYFKEDPWLLFGIGSVIAGLFVYFVLGPTIVHIVSILQHGY
ncbi:hypothetical protein HY468_02980 [Candidatus Roizmanbacteria bacterium]|nr:hypothetical protein [Candidatus Roizmanbacteria bacterium]